MAESVEFLKLWVPTCHSTRRHIVIFKDLVFIWDGSNYARRECSL